MPAPSPSRALAARSRLARLSTRLAALSLALCASGALAEQPLRVTTTADEFDGTCDRHCSLRDAIAQANTAGRLVRSRLMR